MIGLARDLQKLNKWEPITLSRWRAGSLALASKDFCLRSTFFFPLPSLLWKNHVFLLCCCCSFCIARLDEPRHASEYSNAARFPFTSRKQALHSRSTGLSIGNSWRTTGMLVESTPLVCVGKLRLSLSRVEDIHSVPKGRGCSLISQ